MNLTEDFPERSFFVRLPSPPQPTDRNVMIDTLMPTRLTIGPWSITAQHGGAVACILFHQMRKFAHLNESSSSSTGTRTFAPMKLVVVLYSPVPANKPIKVIVEPINISRSIKHLKASIVDPEKPSKTFASADGIFHRSLDPKLKELESYEEAGVRFDEKAMPMERPPLVELQTQNVERIKASKRIKAGIRFFNALEFALTGDGSRGFRRKKPQTKDEEKQLFRNTTLWSKVVDGIAIVSDQDNKNREEADTDHLMVLVGDVGSGASAILEWGKFSYSNIDYNVVWQREPILAHEFPWLCLKSTSRVVSDGTGVCSSEFFDSKGRIGYALQNLVVRVIPETPKQKL